MVHEIHEGFGYSVRPLEGVEEVCDVHGVLDAGHEDMGGVHCQVGEGVVPLGGDGVQSWGGFVAVVCC